MWKLTVVPLKYIAPPLFALLFINMESILESKNADSTNTAPPELTAVLFVNVEFRILKLPFANNPEDLEFHSFWLKPLYNLTF